MHDNNDSGINVHIYSDCCGASGVFNRIHLKLMKKEIRLNKKIDLVRIYSTASHIERSFGYVNKGGVWSEAAFGQPKGERYNY